MPTRDRDHARFVAGLKTALEQKCENGLNDSLAQVMCAAADPQGPAWAQKFYRHFEQERGWGNSCRDSAKKALNAIKPRQP